MVFRGSKFDNLRVLGIVKKLSISTSIPRTNFRITELNISLKNFDIAWVQFENEETVRNIFKQSAVVQSDQLYMFPVIPEMGTERKKDLELKLKSLQRIESRLRYQIRLSDEDFKVFVKIYKQGEYDSYRDLPIEYLDPNNEVRQLKTFTNTDLPEEVSDDKNPTNDEYIPSGNHILH